MMLWRMLTRAGLSRVAQLAVGAGEEVVAEGVQGLLGKVVGHFEARQTVVADAIQQAHERSWAALELWLDRERLRAKLASRQDKDLLSQLDVFYSRSEPLELHGSDLAFRRCCLIEMHQARESGLLDPDASRGPHALARELSDLGHFGDMSGLVDRFREAVEQLPVILEARCPNLAKLLSQRPQQTEPPFLVVAFDYYLTDAIARDEALSRQLAWLGRRRQDRTLSALAQAQTIYGERLTLVRQELSEFRREVQDWFRQIYHLLETRLMTDRPLRARDGFSISDDAEREILQDFRNYWRGLDVQERTRCVDLLRHKVRGEYGLGDFAQAQRDAEELANLATDRGLQAEGHYHVYRAALERRQWDTALSALQQAVQREPHLAPFPLARYEPIRILGAGGFGVAFLCRDKYHDPSDPPIVVKALVGEEFSANTFRDVSRLRYLTHSAIIQVFDSEFVDREAKRSPYVSMAYFDGQPLDELIRRDGPLSVRDVLHIMARVADALAYVHDQRILHRDIKPANILVQKANRSWNVRLIDFGLAQKLEVTIAASTARGQSLRAVSINGSLDYVSPEQRNGEPILIPADIFSFGRTCFFNLFGSPYPSSRQRRVLPPDLDALIDECCEQNPSDRPRNFSAIRDRLVRILKDLDSPSPSSQPPPPQPTGSTKVSEPSKPKPGEPKRQFTARAEQSVSLADLMKQSQTKVLFRRIEPKEFWMGSPDSDKMAQPNEKPRFQTKVASAYEIGVFPVTQAQYRLVTGGQTPSHFKGDYRPVENVSWRESIEFCNALSQKEGIDPYYIIQGDNISIGNPFGFRLPNEVEWECAARGGTETLYPWGNNEAKLGDHAWYSENSGKQTQPVGGKLPNAFGLYDTLGNVWEWCDNAYTESLSGSSQYIIASTCVDMTARSLRGGSWYGDNRFARVAYRYRGEPAFRGFLIGLRAARALP